jgi:D-alanyl-D-alanine carboxypeptidase
MKHNSILLVLALMFVSSLAFCGDKDKESRFISFMKDNPDKIAITLIRNDSVIVDVNSSKIMPLASTVKILVAIEYAEQAASGKINPDEVIDKKDLNIYYVPKTDGGAHPRWLEKLENKPITLREVAKGMIQYSSNANTEYLCHLLGLENINRQREKLGLKNHTEVHYIVSALFVSKELFPATKDKEIFDKLKEVPIDEYIATTVRIHDKLNNDSIYKDGLGKLSLDVQRNWSDNLPASTTTDYVSIMKKLNSKSYFSKDVTGYLDELLEQIMENPANQSWLVHSGTKGGSTAFVLTKALYATDKKGNTTEIAYFFNDLKILENVQLQLNLNDFELSVLSKPQFVEKLVKELNNK